MDSLRTVVNEQQRSYVVWSQGYGEVSDDCLVRDLVGGSRHIGIPLSNTNVIMSPEIANKV